MLLETFITERVGRAESSGHELPSCPWVSRVLRRGLTSGRTWLRTTAPRSRDFFVRPRKPPTTRPMAMCFFLSRKRTCYLCTARCVSCWKCHGPGGLGSVAAVGRGTPVELKSNGSRPARVHELGRARGKQRDLANFVWVAYFSEFFQVTSNRNRMLLAEGATAGPGPFLQGIPSVSQFGFSPHVMRTRVRTLVGVLPAPSEPWAHSCGGGKVMGLQVDECTHLYHCFGSRVGPARRTAQS